MQLILEILRSEQAADPYAFRSGRQDYIFRSAGGGVDTASLVWDQALLADLEAVRLPGRDPEVVQRLGEQLRQFLDATHFPETETKITAAVARGEPVFITLRLAAAELFALPWELLTLRSSGQHLGELPGVLLRYCWPETHSAQEEPDPRPEGGRILLAWSAAAGAVPAAEQQALLMRACAAGHHPFDSQKDVLPSLSCARLTAVLTAAAQNGEPISVLHILCHGIKVGTTFGLGWDTDDQEGSAGGESLVSVDAGRLRQLLAPYAGMIRLVVLCACDSANQAALGGHLGSVAQALHRSGFAAVIASRFPLSVAGSLRLTEMFYGSLLAAPESAENAFLAARQRLLQEAGSLDWASLQLYARPEDGDDSRPIVFRPYRGLEAFSASQSRFFFGREKERQQILEALETLQRTGKPRLLVVAGASGTGKSSVILGGVLPALVGEDTAEPAAPEALRQAVHQLAVLLGPRGQRQAVQQAIATLSREVTAVSSTAPGGWEGAVLRPGDNPLLALQAALDSRRDPARPFLLVVNQFEELFTITQAQAVRQEFAARLWALTNQDSGISCILCLRIDYLGSCGELILDDTGLRLDRVAFQETHRVFIAQMGRDQLREAIEGPARRVGLFLSEALAERMSAEVAGEPGALPLLEYVLDRLWQKRRGRELTTRSYDELGGASGALEASANRVFDALDGQQQRLARRLLLRLTSAAEQLTTHNNRRRATLAELREYVGAPAALFDQVVTAFVTARLLVVSQEDGRALLEVAHEALLRRWERLHRWLAEDRQRLAELQDLELWAVQWRTYGSRLSGAQLGYATQVQKKYPHDLSREMTTMITVSQRFARVRRRRLTLVISCTLAVLSALTIYAQVNKRTADYQARVAQSRTLGMRAELQLERRMDVALLLAAGAIEQKDEFESRSSLATVLERSRYIHTFLRGPAGQIRSIAFSPDGKQLLAAGSDRDVFLFELAGQNTPQRLHRESRGELSTVAFSPDGQYIAAAGNEAAVLLWQTTHPERPPELLRGDFRSIGSIDFSPDGKVLAAGSDDGRILQWDVSTRAALGTPLAAHGQQIAAISFSRGDTPLLASAGGDGLTLLWNLQSRQRLFPSLSGGEEYVSSVAFSPNAQLLATGRVGSVDQSVVLWDTTTGRRHGEVLSGYNEDISGVTFSPDATVLASCSTDKTVQLWEAATGKSLGPPLLAHKDAINACAFSPTGRFLASAAEDVIVLWDLASYPALHRRNDQYQARVSALATSPDGKTLAIGGVDGSLRFWDVGSEQFLGGALVMHRGPVNSLSFRADAQLLASASSDGTVALIEPRKRERLGTLPRAPSGSVKAVAFSGDGTTLASAGVDGSVTLWDGSGRRLLGTLQSKQQSINTVAYRADSQLLATAGAAGITRLWNVATRTLSCELTGDAVSITGLGFSPDGTYLAIGRYDHLIEVWDVRHCPARLTNKLRQHTGPITALAFSPDGTLLAAADQDAAVILWDHRVGQPLGPPLAGHRGAVTALTFTRDGILLSGDAETLWRWDPRIFGGPQLACARAHRNLSLSEWRRYLVERPYCRICATLPAGDDAPSSAPPCSP